MLMGNKIVGPEHLGIWLGERAEQPLKAAAYSCFGQTQLVNKIRFWFDCVSNGFYRIFEPEVSFCGIIF